MTTDMQAPTEIYVWFAENKGFERNGDRFIRAWTNDSARVDGLRDAIGREPTTYRAITTASQDEADLCERIIHAVEGECDGLSITEEQASNILAYLQYGAPICDMSEALRIVDNAIGAAEEYEPEGGNLRIVPLRIDKARQVRAALASRSDAQADERRAFDIALNALQRYQDEWDTGLPSEYAQSERIQMECACEAVREALQEARAAAPQAEAAQGVPEGWVKLAEHAKSLRGLYFNTNLCPEGFRSAVEGLSDEATKLLAAAPSPDREQVGEAGNACLVQEKCTWPDCRRECVIRQDASPSRERGEQDCPHGVDDGACKQCYGEAMSGEQGAALSDDARECLMDVVSHHDNIVAGFAAQRLNACEAGDSDNATYWTHEMNVAHRMKTQAERALAASAPTLGDDPCPFCPPGQVCRTPKCGRLAHPQAAEPKGMAEEQPSFTNPLTPYGMLVRALRIVAGTTLYDMAKALLTTPAKLSAMEFGRAPVTQELAFDVSAYFDALGVPDTLAALTVAANEKARAILAAHNAGAQEPVAWAVYNGWCKIAFYMSEEGARDHVAAAQRSHDLSGSLAAFRAVPLYAHPQPISDAARDAKRYQAIRARVRPFNAYASGNPNWAFPDYGPRGATFDEAIDAEIEHINRAKGE